MHKEVNPEIQIPNPDLGSPPSSGDQQKVDCPTSPRPLALLPSCLLGFLVGGGACSTWVVGARTSLTFWWVLCYGGRYYG